MKASNNFITLLTKYEGLKLNAYPDPGTGAEPITIGIGSTRYQNGKKIKMGDTITKEQAIELLRSTLGKFESIVNKKVTIELNQNQFDALLLHTYNSGGSDTLFKLVNEGKDDEIAIWWTTKYITAGGKQLKGLVKRRKEELDLFNTK